MGEFDIRGDLSRAWANKIAAGTEAIIREGINRKIGSDWTLDSLAGRCRSERWEGATFETYFIDNQPFLELHDLVIPSPEEPISPGAPYVLNATRNYRYL